jgi:hypothetical protein
VSGFLVQERELTKELSRPQLDLLPGKFDLHGSFFDDKQPGTGMVLLNEDVSFGRFECGGAVRNVA